MKTPTCWTKCLAACCGTACILERRAKQPLPRTGKGCRDHWHCHTDEQMSHGCNTRGEVDSACPTCDMVMMPGSEVTRAFYNEYKERLAASICLVSRGGRFSCNRKVKPALRATGACLCGVHNRGALRVEAKADDQAYAATVERDHR